MNTFQLVIKFMWKGNSWEIFQQILDKKWIITSMISLFLLVNIILFHSICTLYIDLKLLEKSSALLRNFWSGWEKFSLLELLSLDYPEKNFWWQNLDIVNILSNPEKIWLQIHQKIELGSYLCTNTETEKFFLITTPEKISEPENISGKKPSFSGHILPTLLFIDRNDINSSACFVLKNWIFLDIYLTFLFFLMVWGREI